MASSGVNLAVTKDGGVYNKLQRPDDYLVSTTSHAPPLAAAIPSTLHASKRKRGQDAVPGSKRTRAEFSFARADSAATIREFGIRTILPGVNEEEQVSDDSTSEALAYLRSVRSEASKIPPLLVATTDDRDSDGNDVRSPYHDTSDTHRLVYKDGIWMALDEAYDATNNEDEWDEDYCNPDPQERCYKLLRNRFQSLRRRIIKASTSSSDQNAAEASKKSRSTQPPRSRRAWLQTIDRDYPTLDQVLQMDERTIYFGLQSCVSSLGHSPTISHKKCCWIWSLLALTGDIGTLDHERISKIRDLGLQAGRLGARLRDSSSSRQGTGDENAFADDWGFGKENSVRQDDKGAIEDSEDTKLGMATDLMREGDIEDVDKINHSSPNVENDVRHGGSLEGGTSEFEAEMSMSENDNDDESHDKAGTKDLEQARARLLAQLGDRLVQPRVPPSRAEAEWQRQQKGAPEPRKGTVQHAHTDSGLSHRLIAVNPARIDADWNTKVAIDMILTVVAECYGQRDLLRFREAW